MGQRLEQCSRGTGLALGCEQERVGHGRSSLQAHRRALQGEGKAMLHSVDVFHARTRSPAESPTLVRAGVLRSGQRPLQARVRRALSGRARWSE